MNPIKNTAGLCVLISLALSGCADLGPLHGPSSADHQAAKQGARLAMSECSSCHAVGTGRRHATSSAPEFTVIAARYRDVRLDWELEAITKVGHYRMPRKALTVVEIADLTAYIRSLDRSAPK